MATNKFNWPAKPDNPVLNRAHPLAQRLILDVNYVSRGSKSEIERVTGIGTATTGTTSGSSNNGAVRVFPGGAATDIDIVNTRGLLADPLRFSLECAVLLNTGGGGGLGRIIDGPFFINFEESSDLVLFYGGWSSAASQWTTGFAPPTGTWFHLVVTYDASTLANAPKYYVNGVLQSGTFANTTPSGTPPTDSLSNPFTIGNRPALGRCLNGEISHVRVWNRSLGLGEVQALYQNPWQTYELPDLYTYNDLIGSSGGTALLSGGGTVPYRPKPSLPVINWERQLTRGLVLDINYYNLGGPNQELVSGLPGTPVSITPAMGPFGPARSWPATIGASDTYVTPASVNNLTKITTELVILPTGDTAAGGGAFTRPFTKGGTTPYFQFQWADLGAGGDLTVTVGWSGGVANWETVGGTVGIYKVGVWNHVVVTYDFTSTANNPILYVNGVNVPITLVTAPSGTPIADTSNLTIGNRPAGDRNVQGAISHFRIWNRILSPAEIGSLYGDPWQIYRAPAVLISVSGGTSYTLSAAQGSVNQTGKAASLNVARLLSSVCGGFAFAGQAATLRHGYTLAAGQGSFVESGGVVLFGVGMPVGQGSIAVAGQAAGLVWTAGGAHTFTLAGALGSFVLTGEPAALKAARKFGVSNGGFGLTGKAVGLARGKGVVAVQGGFVLTGKPVAFRVVLSIKTQCGTLALASGTAGLIRSGWTVVDPATAIWTPEISADFAWPQAEAEPTFWIPKS